MIRDWFFTKRWLIAELGHARGQLAGFLAESSEARAWAMELAAERDKLRDQLLAARLLREGTKTLRAIDPARYLNAAERAELARLRDLEYEMTTRLAELRGDPHV